MYGEDRPRRISLPTYPFARERYWIPEADEVPESDLLQGKLHPLVHENTSDFTRQQFTSRFQGKEFFLRDHRMLEESVLPGVAYLEMARVAGELCSKQAVCQIRNVGWIKPIVVGNTPQDVVICLAQDKNLISFKVFTGEARSGAHTEGFLVTGPWPQAKKIDLEAIERRCKRKVLGKDECYKIFEKHGAHYGPSFQAVETVSIGEDELLARLVLPADIEQSTGEFLLDPRLLDGAFQASIGLGLCDEQSSTVMGVPFALNDLTIHRKLSPSMVAYVRYSHGSGPAQKVPEIDIDLCDNSGEVCVALHKLSFRIMGSSISKAATHSKPVAHEVPGAVDTSAVLILRPAWKATELTPKSEPVHYGSRIVILVEFDERAKNAVDQRLANPSILLAATQSGIDSRYVAYAQSIFTHLKAILLEKPKEKVLVQVVVPSENIEQVFSGLGALLSTVKQENPKILGQVLAMSKAEPPQLLADRLEQCAQQLDLFVRYRNGICEQRTWEQAFQLVEKPSAWNATDCILMTGGAGRLGRLMAVHLASGAPGIRLFLAGRSASGPETDRAVQELTELGAVVTYLPADISDKGDVEKLVRVIANGGQPLTGVIHAAGVIHDNFMVKKNVDEMARVLAPKVTGLVHLDEATKDCKLKHFIAFASSAGALGNIGQSDYAAANAFMDAYSHYRNDLVAAGKRHGKSTAIDWPLWQEGGMKVPESLQKIVEQKFGLKALSTPSGLRAFDQCLQCASNQLLVLSGVHRKIASVLGIAITPEVPAASAPTTVADEKETSVAEAPPSSAVAKIGGDADVSPSLISLRDRASAFVKKACSGVLQIPAAQFQNLKSFSSYGIDSLMVADITNELEKGLGALPKTLFFQYQNIDELTDYLLENHKEQLQELLGNTVSTHDTRKGVAQQGSGTQAGQHSNVGIDKGPKRKTEAAATQSDRMPPTQMSSELTAQYGELLLKSELTASQKVLLESIAGKAFLGSYLFDLWPWFYLSRCQDAFFHALLDEGKTLFVTCYRGATGGERKLLQELNEFARSRKYQVCYWSFVPPDAALEEANGWVSSPIGVVQVIPSVADFDLSGARGRKLRYVVNRFAQAGHCETRECMTLTDEVRRQIADVVAKWCEHKKFVHSVKPFIAELKEGTWQRRYRMFLTYLDGALQNVLLVAGNARDGYLMDQEYYRPEMPVGGTEYAVVEIINRLKNEGCGYFSLGMTWGVIDDTVGSDVAGKALLAGMKEKETFLSKVFELGEKNYRFKNKFQPARDVSCFYRPTETKPEVIIRFLSVFMEKGVPFGEIQELLGDLTCLPMVAGPERIEQSEFPQPPSEFLQSQDESPKPQNDRPFDVTKISPNDVRVDMISDSWVYLRSDYAKSRILQLTERIENTCDYESVIRDVLGCAHVHLAPLGRTAERLFFQAAAADKGKVVANLLFETAIHNLVSQGFHLIEAPDPRVYDLNHSEVFRGGIDLERLQESLDRHKGTVKMVFLELCNNASGGHPVSMGQLRQLDSLAALHGHMLVLDITRIVKNALLIRDHEQGYAKRTTWSIVREMVGHADCVVGSLSKEFGINLGGIVGSKRDDITARVREFARMEGGYISEIERGVVGEAFRGLTYVENSCIAQMESTKRFGKAMEQAGIPCVTPAVAHCVVVPVRQVPGYEGQRHVSESFLQWFWEKTGIRGGVHLPGKQKGSSLNECARFCIPMGFAPGQEQWVVRQIGELSHKVPGKPLVKTPSSLLPAAHADRRNSDADMAIVGMSGRFPGAHNIHEFWSNVEAGTISIGEIPKKRWDWQKVFDNPSDPRISSVRWGAFMPDVESFDSRFFDVSRREARLMDPQQRLMLLCAWEAIEDACYTRKSLRQNKTGVFVAFSSTDSTHSENMPESDRIIGLGTVGSIAASRISYHLNLQGPSETYDTGCSSSFLALHRAIQAIRMGDCSQAIVGGVQVLSGVRGFKDISAIGFLSRTGHVRSFDERADGYVRSEAVAALLIKPVEVAIAAGDHIYALIKGTGLCHGGAGLSLTTPSVNGMKEAMLQAYRQAGADPRSVQYIEAHGIASPMGDALEIEALKSAYTQLVSESKHKLPASTCHIGSLKPNIGHPEVASGMCALIKVVMALRKRVLPGIPGFEQLNSRISMNGSPIVISGSNQAWNSTTDHEGRSLPRRASANSYGVGGVNAHVLIEEYPHSENVGDKDLPQSVDKALLFVFSARQRESLDNYVKKFVQYLQSGYLGSIDLESIAQTLQIGRESFEKRLAVLASSKDELTTKLEFYLAHSSDIPVLAQNHIFTGHSETADLPASIVNGNGASSAIAQAEQIAAAWAGGADIRWEDLYAGRRQRRVPLPTYAFAQEHHETHYGAPQQIVLSQPVALKSGTASHRANGAANGAFTANPGYVAPRDETERRMANIWSEVLGVDRIGIHDDFFELGGHSLLALQLANRLAMASFDCSMRELYDRPTICKLSQRTRSEAAPSSLPARSFPLLPIQAMLIGRKPANDASSRDAVPSFIEIHRDVDEQTLVQALQHWYTQDIFRLRFRNPLGEWRQYYCPEIGDVPVRWLDAGQFADGSEKRRSLLQIAHDLEKDLDIFSGPLIQIGLVRSGGRVRYMIWVTDHLVIDNFSFFTLFTNLKLCYQNALRNRPFRFSRDVVIAEWAEHLLEVAHSPEVAQEIDYWMNHFPAANEQKRCLGSSARNGAPGRIQSLTRVISDGDTASSYSFLSRQKFTLEELCLASLLMGHRKCCHASDVLVRMVANGRHAGAEGLDLTRGLGWFSVQYPALFHLEAGDNQDEFLNAVIRQHRTYQDKREHYGLLRYMNHESGPKIEPLEDWSQAIAFNCLGEIGPQSPPDDPFWLDRDGLRALLEFAEERQDYDRGFWFFVSEGKLHVQVLFRTGAFRPEEMEDLLQKTVDSLLHISQTAPARGPEAGEIEECVVVESECL
jgi:acyl transferase domain-containing protein/tryptophanase/acyl carrier protein